MENLPINHYEEPFYDTKFVSITDVLNQPLLQSSSGILSNSPTYTPLEPLYPEASAATSSPQYLSYPNSSSVQTITYTPNLPNYMDLSMLPSPFYRDQDFNHTSRDEGLGSSPSSYSSSSPPLIQPQPVPSRPSSICEYSHRSSSNSPASTVSSNYSTAPECSNCGSRYDIYWQNTHYLCRQCLPERPTVVATAPPPPPQPQQPNTGKRKRSTATTKNINQICTNCEATNSKLWRRSVSSGLTVCNACGLYEKLHGVPRPKEMRKDTIQTRNRKSKESKSSPKSKKLKKSSKKSQEVSVQQPQYIPNTIPHYALPNYQTLQVRNIYSNVSSPHATAMDSHHSLYVNYRPELYRHDIYNPVPPNEVINISSNMNASPNSVSSPSIHFTNS